LTILAIFIYFILFPPYSNVRFTPYLQQMSNSHWLSMQLDECEAALAVSEDDRAQLRQLLDEALDAVFKKAPEPEAVPSPEPGAVDRGTAGGGGGGGGGGWQSAQSGSDSWQSSHWASTERGAKQIKTGFKNRFASICVAVKYGDQDLADELCEESIGADPLLKALVKSLEEKRHKAKWGYKPQNAYGRLASNTYWEQRGQGHAYW
jgi:hypothetical protein